MNQVLYLEIVEHYIKKSGLKFDEEVRAESLRWCQLRGQRSGRAAYQFSKHWIGAQQLQQNCLTINKLNCPLLTKN